MIFKFEHQNNAWATHQPVLYKMCSAPHLHILEFGCGHNSTRLLSLLAENHGHKVECFESNLEWIQQCKQYETDRLKINLVEDWTTFFKQQPFKNRHYDIIFVDQSPWEARHLTIDNLYNQTNYLILHDADHFPNHNFFQFADYFRYFKLFLPNPPYPYVTGPPTLLASNYFSCEINIDFSLEVVQL